MIGIFLSRPKGLNRVEFVLGVVVAALTSPVGGVVVLNIRGRRECCMVVLPSLVIVFLIIELLFDYILKMEFRNTAVLWPYLLLYHVSLMGMIGYCFLVGRSHGFTTLVTYFLNLLATWHSYAKVGHG